MTSTSTRPPAPDVDPANQSVPQRHPLGSWHHPRMPWQSAWPRHHPSPRKVRPEPKWMACLKGRDGRDGLGMEGGVCFHVEIHLLGGGKLLEEDLCVFCWVKWPFFDILIWFQVPGCLFCLEWGAVLFVYQPQSQSLDVLVCDFNQVEDDTTSNLNSGPISYTP